MADDRHDDDRVIAMVWPEGMPDRERVIWEGLLPAMKGEVLNRLEAAWRAECGEPWEPLAKGLGLGRAAFYNLRRAWRERSLEGVVPHGVQAPRRVEAEPDSKIRIHARLLLTSAGTSGRNLELARRLLTENGDDPDIGGRTDQTRLQWAERLIRHERRSLAQHPAYLSTNYGRRLVIDLTAISIRLKDATELAIAAVCLDAGSGMVLGSSLGRLEAAIELERDCIQSARRFLFDNCADRAESSWPLCDLDLMTPPGLQHGEVGSLEAATNNLELRLPGTYAFGQELVQSIGPRVGRISLAPRKTLIIDSKEFGESRNAIELSEVEARGFWNREVLRHNEPILSALTKCDFWGKESGDGRMAEALAAVEAWILTSIAARR